MKIVFKGIVTGNVYDAIIIDTFVKKGITFHVVLIDNQREIIRDTQIISWAERRLKKSPTKKSKKRTTRES